MSNSKQGLIDFIKENGKEVFLQKGSVIKDSSSVYLIRDGIIAEHKDTVILDIYRRKEVVLLNGTYLSALSNCSLYSVKKSLLSKYSIHIFDLLESKLKFLADKHHRVCTSRVEKRLADLLCSFGERYGIHNGRSVFVPFSMSRSRLSEMINCRPETVSRVFTDWESKSMIEISREGFDLCDLASYFR